MSVRIKWLGNAFVSVPEEAKREAERALAKVDLGGLGDYERDGSSAMLYSGGGLLLKLASGGQAARSRIGLGVREPRGGARCGRGGGVAYCVL
jgi:hypothetical protein